MSGTTSSTTPEHESVVRVERPDPGPDEPRTGTTGRIELGRRRFFGTVGASATAGLGIVGTASADESLVVAMGNTYFDPIGLHVEPGTTVQFEIEAGSHSATAYEDRIPVDATAFDSGVISDGTFEHTFDVPGTYDYYCIPHRSSQVGRIVVGDPGGPAEQSPIPDGSVPDSETIVDRGAVPIDDAEDAGAWCGGAMVPHGGAMGPGSMDRGAGWWLLPIGATAALLGAAGVLATWGSRRGPDDADDEPAAMTTLRERYARGDIDKSEYERRREMLED